MKQIYHRYETWECFKAGFYDQSPPNGMTDDQCREAYRKHLADPNTFQSGIDRVFAEWVISCEHFLTNVHINRIAWLGQASMCILTGVPSKYRSGFYLLSKTEQVHANRLSEYNIRDWSNSAEFVRPSRARVSGRLDEQRVFGWNTR